MLRAQIQWDSAARVLDIPLCSALYLDGEDNLYLIDKDKTTIFKYLSAFNYDSVQSLGGKSHRAEGFLEITDLDVTNRQTGYVLDRGRQRVSLIHPNLRVLEDMSLVGVATSDRNTNPEDLLVSRFAANSAGELFLLNLLDNRVYVLSSFGEWSLSFGGTDYGAGSIYQPAGIRLNQDNYLFISEPTRHHLLVFDIYGTFRYQVKTPESLNWTDFQLVGPYLLLKGKDEAGLLDTRSSKLLNISYPVQDVIDFSWGNGFVYFLTENQVHLYSVPTEE
ncbi:MAG: hypothetical protein NWR72_15045 [Bacteroidia bacterium]|nr:hypothetical protein [Bacteroidia bacterium]